MIDAMLSLARKNKAILAYLSFGVLTTVIKLVLFEALVKCSVNALTANCVAWVVCVVTAFFTNRKYVFGVSGEKNIGKELAGFFAARLVTLGVEEVIIFFGISKMTLPSILVELIATAVTVVLNYVLSKVLVFKNKGEAKK